MKLLIRCVYVREDRVSDSEALYQLPKRCVPVPNVHQLNIQCAEEHEYTHARTHAHGPSPGLYNRMLDSLKILRSRQPETMACFVRNVSASLLPEMILLGELHHHLMFCWIGV